MSKRLSDIYRERMICKQQTNAGYLEGDSGWPGARSRWAQSWDGDTRRTWSCSAAVSKPWLTWGHRRRCWSQRRSCCRVRGWEEGSGLCKGGPRHPSLTPAPQRTTRPEVLLQRCLHLFLALHFSTLDTGNDWGLQAICVSYNLY